MTLFWHSLRQQRLALILWALVLAALIMSVLSAAGVLNTDLGAFVAALPQAAQKLMNMELLAKSPIDGYLYSKVFMMWPVIISIYAAFQAAAMVAREVERRQMDFVLSLPVSRAQLLWHRIGALWTGIAVLWAATVAVIVAGLARQGLQGDLTGYLLAAWNGFMLNAALGAIALWASAGASEYRRALRTGLGLPVALYLVDMALQTVNGSLVVRRLLLYGFYDPDGLILTHRFPWMETAVLALATLAAALLAVRTFARREV